MAITGKLKGFGIADILQLIGQQQKTGVLYLKLAPLLLLLIPLHLLTLRGLYRRQNE